MWGLEWSSWSCGLGYLRGLIPRGKHIGDYELRGGIEAGGREGDSECGILEEMISSVWTSG
jgi:hypothetical protein